MISTSNSHPSSSGFNQEENDMARLAEFGVGAGELSALLASRDYDDVERIARDLKTCLESGIRTHVKPTLSDRKRIFGSNTYHNCKPPSSCKSLWTLITVDVMCNFMIFLVSALVSTILVNALEDRTWDSCCDFDIFMVVITLAVMTIPMGYYEQYLQFQDLAAHKEEKVCVTRDNQMKNLPITDLVVGDVVQLSPGKQVPADGIYISGHNLLIDESGIKANRTGGDPINMMNGETRFILAGTIVQDGWGTMLVVAVGMRTCKGRMMKTSQRHSRERETWGKEGINGIATMVMVLVSPLLIFLVIIASKTYNMAFLEFSTNVALKLLSSFSWAASSAFLGKASSSTLNRCMAARQLAKKGVVLRNLSSFETLASVNTICCDKTGTLTSNRMVVHSLFICNQVLSSSDASKALKSIGDERVPDILFQSLILNTCSEIVDYGSGKKKKMGNPTELALLEFGLSAGGRGVDSYQQQFRKVEDWPFSSLRKRRSMLVAFSKGINRIFCTGRADIILQSCTKILNADGESAHLSEETRQRVQETIDGFCAQTLRTLSLAFKDVYNERHSEVPDSGYTLIAVIGLADPLRPGVEDAIQKCLAAGVTLCMITGDNINTAKAIAKTCGIFKGNESLAIEGEALHGNGPEDLKELIMKTQVFASCSPEDKRTVVSVLKSAPGKVVAVVGNGINDTLALREADLGVAIGDSDSEAAKENSDVILVDGNFGSLVYMAEWGCTVYVSSRKLLNLLLTPNVVALTINFVSLCYSGYALIPDAMLFWANLVFVLLDSSALDTEPSEELMNCGSFQGESFISKTMWKTVFGQSLYQVAILIGLLLYKEKLFGFEGPEATGLLNTLLLYTFIFLQVLNWIKHHVVVRIDFLGISHSCIFTAIVFSTLMLQSILLEFLGTLQNTSMSRSSQLMFLGILTASASCMPQLPSRQ